MLTDTDPLARAKQKKEEEDEESALVAAGRAGVVADVVSGVLVDEFLCISSRVPMEIGTSTVPARMAVTGVKLFGSAGMFVSKMYCRKALQGLSLASQCDFVKGMAQSTIVAGAIEAQAARQIIIRVPIIGRSFVERFMSGLGTSELEAVAAAQVATTVRQVGLRGRVLVIVASLLVHEIVEFSWMFASGSTTRFKEFILKTARHMAAAMGSLSGGMVGTAMGSLALPGIGTGIGSLAGSIIGASLAELASSQISETFADPRQDQFRPSAGEPTGCIELLLAPEEDLVEPAAPAGFIGPPPPPAQRTVTIECDNIDQTILDEMLKGEAGAEAALGVAHGSSDDFSIIGSEDIRSDGSAQESADSDEEGEEYEEEEEDADE
ncbi:hypothetical protein DIPPA_01704 [Diplonema papillatum]|nr:hypothetical protein DIPPA_01704 [Diplonema papillatum]